jgi:hypothetical protein
MRTLLIGALAATLVGCSCLLPPQAGIQACTDANGFACFDKTAASQPIEPRPTSFEANSATIIVKSTIAAKAESSAHARDRVHRATKTAKSTMIPAKVESPASGQPADNAAAGSKTTGDRSDHSETALHGDAEKTAPASLNNTDLLVALLIARPEIKSVSDLANKNIAVDARQSASNSSVRTAIAAAGATEVQLSEGQTKAIDRLISGEVPAAVLALVSPEGAERFPEIAGFTIFRIPLSPRAVR